ncbi:biofilm peroxide resistance protein BsmA [Erwinia billingiae]|uniref:biofilm peroxide resistance protein BsmA n=1 Tax=Erwinia billingiae TaxID=182337 RepID=UPI0005A13DF4|nr:biofilm peroxide resistance protein BsmA [Erwinia billingiae]
MSRLLTVLLVLLTVGCSQLQTTPEPPPPPTSHAQEVTRAQSLNLRKIGTVSVNERGSPDDAQRAIAAKANAAGATYYYIQLVSETVMPGLWYSSAILYGPSAAAGAQ